MEEVVDHGYAWIAALISTIISFFFVGLITNFSVLMVYLQNDLQISIWKLTIIPSIMTLTTAIFGLLAGRLADKLGCRKLLIFGTISIFLSYLISSVVRLHDPNHTLYLLYANWGLLIGLGAAFYTFTAAVNVNEWFSKRKSLANSLSSCGLSFGLFIWGPLTYWMTEYYGSWRSTILIMASIYANGFALAAIMRLSPVQKAKNLLAVTTHLKKKTSSKLKIFHFRLLKNPLLLLILLSNFGWVCGHSVMILMMPTRAEKIGIGVEKGTYAISAIAIGSLSVRPIIGYAADYKCFNRILMFAISILSAGIITIISAIIQTFPVLIVSSVLYGISSGFFVSLHITILTDVLPIDKLTGAMGLNIFSVGIASVISSTSAGIISDNTSDTRLLPIIFGSIQIIFGSIPAFIVTILKKRTKPSLTLNNEINEQVIDL